MRASLCNAVLSGSPVFANDFTIYIGNSGWFFNATKPSISPNKQMMMGWLSANAPRDVCDHNEARRALIKRPSRAAGPFQNKKAPPIPGWEKVAGVKFDRCIPSGK